MRGRAPWIGLVLLLLAGALCARRPDRAGPTPVDPAPGAPAPSSARRAAVRDDAPREAAEAPRPGTAPVASGTSLLVLRWRTDGIDLVGQVVKPSHLTPDPGDAATAVRWRLADAATGRVLAEGPVTAPRLCGCELARDHARGCVRVRHEAVVRLKVPHLAPRERLVIHDGDRELAALDLEGTS